MEILVKAGQLILSLSILIVLHEMGHFLPAKWFKTRVDKFYLFFDPWFELFKKKIGETEYGIGWLPLGGYVKIAGMIDESFDTEQMKQPPQPWEFRSKPAWQRLIIMVGGVTVNFILGFFIYAMIMWTWGEEFFPTKNLTYGVAPDSIGTMLGIQKGDKVLAVGDSQLLQFNSHFVRNEIIINRVKTLDVERNGQRITLQISKEATEALSKYKNKDFELFTPRRPFVVGEIANKKAPAAKAGIKKEDQIIALNGESVVFFDEFFDKLMVNPQKNKEITVTIVRKDSLDNSKTDTSDIKILTDENGKIGAGTMPFNHFFKTERKEYTLLASLPAGVAKGWGFLENQVKAFGQMFKGNIKASDSLGSFLTIGAMYPGQWDWERFWQMTAVLSLVLGFINLLPIPALDGGHVMFLIWEVLTGKKPSDKVMEYSTMAGFVLLIGLMVYALGLDISRLF